MNGEFNIHAARRLEARLLASLPETSAIERSEELHRLLCAFASKGGTFSTSLLNEELKVIFAAYEKMIDTAIANRMDLAASAPELLNDQRYLRELHRALDEMADCAVDCLRQRHAGPVPAGRFFPQNALNAVLREAEEKATMLKKRIDIEIEKMALKGMPPRPSGQITNIFHAPVSNVAQNSENIRQIVTSLEKPIE